MASRSGSITPDAARALKKGLSPMTRSLKTSTNNNLASLASVVQMIYASCWNENKMAIIAHSRSPHLSIPIHKAIGSMLVAMNGCDLLVFTGTVGERSAIIRKRIVAHLEFCDFILDGDLNDACIVPTELTSIAQPTRSPHYRHSD